jgi:hypothetical protein
MEELIKQMNEELEKYVFTDKETGVSYGLVEVEKVKHICEKYIRLTLVEKLQNSVH